jgi:hypothetical protein
MNNNSHSTQTKKGKPITWLIQVLYRPGYTFTQIYNLGQNIWLLPILTLNLSSIVKVAINGWVKQQAAMLGETPLPPGFEWYTPEQQAQYFQATEATQGPIFVYILPIVLVLTGIWLSWLFVGGTLHLTTTLSGGRGDTSSSMTTVAWSTIPFVIKDIIQIIYLLISRILISAPGLSGFITINDSGWSIFWSELLKHVDIYLIWNILLMMIGVKIATNLNTIKSFYAAMISVTMIVIIRTLMGCAIAQLTELTIIRPFFF